ncbi:MAG: MASE1 domain-containing protein [Rhodospirillales bacterium]|nr:MASE1 domain-containing protein [Rhodospirillales bacterium]
MRDAFATLVKDGRPLGRANGLWGAIGLYWLAHMVLEASSTMYSYAELAINPWNPPAGLALFFLLAKGPRLWPAVMAANFASDRIFFGQAPHLGIGLVLALQLGLVYGGAALILTRLLQCDLRLERLRDLLKLTLVGLITPIFAGGLYILTLISSGVLVPTDMWAAVGRYWVGDVIAILVLTTTLLKLRAGLADWPRPGLETGLQTLVIGAVLWIVFGVDSTDEFKFFYLLFPPLIWIAVRQGLRGAAAGLVLTQVGMMAILTVKKFDAPTVTALQVLMLVLAVAILFLGCVVDERGQAEAKRREDQMMLAHMARLSLAGEMASGLAHELNQPLSAIVNYLRAGQNLFSAQPPRLDEASGVLEKARAQAMRASKIIENLREFLRKRELKTEPVRLDLAVAESLNLIAAEARRKRVRVESDVPAGLPRVWADRVQLEQVLINLIANALDAIAEGTPTKREVTITARPEPAGFITLTVADRGPGIAPEMRETLFAPFASSKDEGMGLGLSICRTIIEAHGGKLWVEDNAPQGAAFSFTLPRAEEPHAD